MNRKWKLFAVISIAALSLVVFLLRVSERADESPKGFTSTQPDSQKIENQQSYALSTQPNSPKVAQPHTELDRAVRSHQLKQEFNRPIAFYGRVLDQDNAPVGDALVEIEISKKESSLLKVMSGAANQTSEYIKLRTDAQGLFSIQGKDGFYLGIQDISKPGYLKPEPGRNVVYQFLFGGLGAPASSPQFHHPSQVSPVIYILWKKKGAERLISRPSLIVEVTPAKDQQKMALNLLAGKAASPEGRDADVRIHGFARSKDDWEVSIIALNGGGFIPVIGQHDNLAPEDGYQESVIFRSRDLNAGQEFKPARFYFRGRAGSFYGVFSIAFQNWTRNRPKPEGGDFWVIFQDIKINAHGSRNLEFQSGLSDDSRK